MKFALLPALTVAALGWPAVSGAAPVTLDQAATAATNFLVQRYALPANAVARTITPFGQSHLAVESVAPWKVAGRTIGFIASLTPAGYVLLGAEDEVPPVKLHSDAGAFGQLPPGFVRVVELELTEDLVTLAAMKQAQQPINPAYRRQWLVLFDPTVATPGLADLGPAGPNYVLLTTSWGQGAPYNYYCNCAEGGHAVAGCGATALAQILRYAQEPAIVAANYAYTDAAGGCTGAHALSDYSLWKAYDWANMPNAVTSSSPEVQKRAVGHLVYHAGVVLDSDYDPDGTASSISYVPFALRFLFNYSCGAVESKAEHSAAAWYGKIAADVDAYRPIRYGMWEADGSDGHAVVCDGYRNGNEIHLNLGWDGSDNAWYNMDSVSAGGWTWTIHRAVFRITPPFIYVDRSYAGARPNGALATPFPAVADGVRSARNPTTVRIAVGNYHESLTITQHLRMEARSGTVRIGAP